MVNGNQVKNPKPTKNSPTNLSVQSKAYAELICKKPFFCKIGSTDSGNTVSIKIEFVQKCEWIEQRFSFLLSSASWGRFETKLLKPSFKERLSKKLTKTKTEIPVKFNLIAEIEMSSEILSIESNYPSINFNKENKKANVKYNSNLSPDVPFNLLIKVKDAKSQRIWITPQNDQKVDLLQNVFDDTSFLMYSVLPNFDTKSDFEVIFLVDNSISMKENSYSKICKKLLDIAFKTLPNECLFNLITFGNEPVWMFPKSEPKNKKSLSKATKFLSSLKFNSKNSVFIPALEILFDPEQCFSKCPRQIILITDGYVNGNIFFFIINFFFLFIIYLLFIFF